MSGAQKPAALLDQQSALSSYLDALLQEVPEYIGEHPLQEPPPPAPEAEPVPPPQPIEPLPSPSSGPPTWGRERFQCLLFKVAGLSLAVPLAQLSGVVPWPDALTALPNRSALFLGLMRHQERNVKVVDTALIVVPEAHRERGLASAGERLKHVVLLDEGRWGLACDAIGEVVTLESDGVRWRSAAGKRPWLAGTVLQHLCALLDVEAFVGLLETGIEVPRRV